MSLSSSIETNHTTTTASSHDGTTTLLSASNITTTEKQQDDDDLTGFDHFLQILLIIVAVIGTVGNVWTLAALIVPSRNGIQPLRRQLKRTSLLVGALAFSDFLVCGVGVPLTVANMYVGYAPPFSTNAVLCHAVEILPWGSSNVSVWLMFWLAFTRALATFWPSMWQRYMSPSSTTATAAAAATVAGASNTQKFSSNKNFFSISSHELVSYGIMLGMVLASYCLGFGEYVLGAVFHMYDVQPIHPGSGVCSAFIYNFTDPASATLFRDFVIIDTSLHCWTPLLAGLMCYGAIYLKFAWRKRHQPTTRAVQALVATTTTTAAAVPAKGGMGRSQQRHREKIRTLALAFLGHIFLTFPSTTLWGLGYTIPLESTSAAWVIKVVTVMYYCSFPINPILYGLLSKDFRYAYALVLDRLCCCRVSFCGRQMFEASPTSKTQQQQAASQDGGTLAAAVSAGAADSGVELQQQKQRPAAKATAKSDSGYE